MSDPTQHPSYPALLAAARAVATTDAGRLVDVSATAAVRTRRAMPDGWTHPLRAAAEAACRQAEAETDHAWILGAAPQLAMHRTVVEIFRRMPGRLPDEP